MLGVLKFEQQTLLLARNRVLLQSYSVTEMLSNTSDSNLKPSELLYLIYQYFQSCPGLEVSAQALRSDLATMSAMGTSIGWNGVPRVCDVSDVARTYPNIAPQHLLYLLNATLGHLSTSTSVRPTLLHQVNGVFNPCSTSQQRRFHELSSKFLEVISKHRAANQLAKRNSLRISFLEKALNKNADIDSDAESERLVPDLHTYDTDVIPVLQSVGRTKELAHLQSQIQSSKDSRDLLSVEIDTLTRDMAQLGCLVSGINRGHLDSGLCWLQARELGVASMGSGSGLRAGQAFVPSAASVQTKLATRYRLLWTVSGHMMNPAYCCVFDQTGRYILSGADDYLVKIWDVATGQLIRTCKGHMGYISLVAVSPDNSLFASACTMGTIRIWRMSDGLCLQVFKHQASVNWIKFDRTSCALASASDDGHCIVWDLSRLLPEDSSDVPILDVIIENRTAALKAASANHTNGSSSNAAVAPRNRELDQLVDDAVEMGGTQAPPQLSTGSNGAHEGHSGGPTSDVGAHAGEARLLSAVSSGAAALATGLRGQRGGPSDSFGGAVTSGGVWDHLANGHAVPGGGGGPMHAPVNPLNSRGGLFRWSGGLGGAASSQEADDAMLALHHVEDMFQINRAGDPLKVQCLDISPMGNILVTGCEDGVGRVWRIGDPEQLVGYSTRQVRLPIEDTLMKLKVLCSPNEYERLRRVASHLLLRLEGHVSPITDIHLNHLGDRVLTGSAQDCSVRIWSLSRVYTKSVQVMLDLSEDDDGGEDGADGMLGRGRGGRNARAVRQKSQLYNACWTCESSKIVTIQSVLLPGRQADALPTRLKVWDSMTGDLLRVIWKVSDISCRSLCTHPLNPKVVATCGEDGFINVWDVDQEERLSSARLFNEDKTTPSNIVDASFSEDGTRIAVTDFLGRLSVLGLEDPERYQHVRQEQYFSTDYLDIMLDNSGFAIDVGTQLPVHEAPIGPLIRMDGTPYDTQPAPLRGPPPMPKDDVREMLADIAADRKKAMKEMDRVFSIFARNQSRGRLPRKYRGVKPKSVRHAEELARQQAMAGAAAPVQRESRVQYIEFDVNTYNPSTDESEDSDYRRERSPDVSRPHRFRGSRSAREPRETRARVATLQTTASGARRSGRARTHVESYDDAVGLEDGAYVAPRSSTQSRSARAQRRETRRREQRRMEDDYSGSSGSDTASSGSGEMLLLSSDEEVGRSTRRSGRGRKARRGVIHSDDEDADALIDAHEAAAPRPKKPKPAVFTKTKHGTVVSEGVEIGRRWLQNEALTPQYSPQMGDKVMYFPQGHIQWLQVFQESSSPPWMAFPQKWPVVECEVRKIQYVFPDTPQEHKVCNSVKAIVQLAVVRVPLRHAITTQDQYVLEMVAPRATRHSSAKEITFTVTLRDWDMPDFLVPSDVFMRSIRLAWHRGVRVNVPFKDYSTEEKRYVFKTYYGTVNGISNATPEWPHSPWDCIQIIWEDSASDASTESERVGPWEAIPQFDASSDYARILAQFPITKVEDDEAQRILEGIDTLMVDPRYAAIFQPFAFEVDSTVFPSYYSAIPVPICVELIRQRLINGYYRQLEAIEYDVNLMHQNCVNYNYDESEIVVACRQLQKKLHAIIRPDVVPGTQAGASASSSSAVVDDSASQWQDANAPDPALSFRIRGTSSRSAVSRHAAADQTDSLVHVGSSRSRGGSTRYSGDSGVISDEALVSDTVLRIKRPRDHDQDDVGSGSAAKSRRQEPREEALPSTARGTRTSGRGDPEDTRGGRRSSRAAAQQTATASTSRSGRRGKAVNYAEASDSAGDEGDEGYSQEEGAGGSEPGSDSSGNSDDSASQSEPDSDGSGAPRRSSRARRASSSPAGRRSGRQASEQDRSRDRNGSSSRRPARKASRSSRPADSEDEDDRSDAHYSGDSEEEVTTRSRRVVKAPANFLAELAAAEQARNQVGRSSRRKEVLSPDPTPAGRNVARMNPSQRYQQAEQERQRQAAATAAERSRHQRHTQGLAAHYGAGESSSSHARRLDPDVKRQMLQVVDCADELDAEYGLFAQPVTEDEAPGYFEIVLHPVDLGSVRDGIHKRRYESAAAVVADILQMYDNCELYNDESSVLSKEARRQRKEFQKFCKKNALL